jgi:hypothetical protein
VAVAAEAGIHLGATGREPLNNQPYFRMKSLGDGTPVHGAAKEAFNYILELVKELSAFRSEAQAREALRADVAVRRRYQPRYTQDDRKTTLTPERFPKLIADFVSEDSEGGKRAQAVAAGLLDVFAGPARVESGRINDPSRQYPGDVCVRMTADPKKWAKAFEVRDKPVSVSDIQIFGKKCVDMGVLEAAVVMVADNQPGLDESALAEWASGFGLGLTLFQGWRSLAEQVLFWAELPKPEATVRAVERIESRLVAVEASPEAVTRWQLAVRR